MPRSKRVNRRSPEKLSRVGKDVVYGLKEAAAHVRGEISLRAYEYDVPGPVDVKAIRAKSGLSQSQFARRFGFSNRTLQD
jgi:putative transcriptional regulator